MPLPSRAMSLSHELAVAVFVILDNYCSGFTTLEHVVQD